MRVVWKYNGTYVKEGYYSVDWKIKNRNRDIEGRVISRLEDYGSVILPKKKKKKILNLQLSFFLSSVHEYVVFYVFKTTFSKWKSFVG